MADNIKELIGERLRLVGEMRALTDTVTKAKRAWTVDEQQNFDKLNTRVDEITEIVDAADRADKVAAREKQLSEIRSIPADQNVKPANQPVEPVEYRTSEKYSKDFRSFLVGGNVAPEMRALQADSNTGGGYLVPQQFATELIAALKNIMLFRQKAKQISISTGDSIGAPALDNDVADLAWTAEIGAFSEDSTMSFGKRELTTHQLTKGIKVSRKLLRASALNVESIVRDNLAYKNSTVQENAFFNGTGAAQPLGVFVGNANGIPANSTHDISTGNTTTAIGPENVFEITGSIAGQYLAGAEWYFHRLALKKLRQLKTGDGQWLWQPGLAAGMPQTLDSYPINVSEYCPSTFTTGLYVGLFGNLQWYWILDSLTMDIQRLDELYAATNQVGFIIRSECDGMPVLAAAFRRMKLA